MSHYKLYASKYQSQATQFSNPVSMIVALCEKALSCIATARAAKEKNDSVIWCSNLATVNEIIHLISATISENPNDKTVQDVQKFYMQLALYTSALIADKIDYSKSQDLLEAFRTTRDTWKSVEQQYVELRNKSNNYNNDGTL